MKTKTPSWALPQCGFCRNNAHAACQSWDNVDNGLYGAPLCRGHIRRRASLTLCPVHAHGQPASGEQAEMEQAVFDFSFFERTPNDTKCSTPAQRAGRSPI